MPTKPGDQIDRWSASFRGEDELNKALREMARTLLQESLSRADEYQAEKLVRNFSEHLVQLHELLLWKHGVAPQQLEGCDMEQEEIEAKRLQIRRQMMDHMRIVRERYETMLGAMPGLSDN